MSSITFGSILIFASCVGVLVIYYVGEFFLNGRGHIPLLKNTNIYDIYTYFVLLHYNGWCWYI